MATEREARIAGRTWFERSALAFVALSLVLLLITPLLLSRGTDEIRDRIDEVADPARELVTEVQFELAREMAALRGYLMTADTSFLRRRRAAAARQNESVRALEPLVRELGVEAQTALLELRARTQAWHDRARPGSPGRVQSSERSIVPEVEQRLFERALEAANELDQAVAASSRALRQQIRLREARALIVTLVLAALALGSAGVLVWFGHRMRVLAREAERQRREAESALAENRRTVQARERLVRGVTHDVKNPLGAADGYAELLELGLRGPLTSEQAQMVGSIRRSIRSATGIIDDLLELARAERGSLPVRVDDVVLNDLVVRTLALHAGVLEAAGMRGACAVPERPVVARTDARRVEQVLANLLSNAIKYSRSGRVVEVRLEQEAAAIEEESDWAVIAVRDDGVGIPPEQIEDVFLEFYRLDPSTGSGHGLGLAISRHIARQLGGDLTARSVPGEGATFLLRLPLARAPTSADLATEPA